MAKNMRSVIYLFILYSFSSGCVHKDKVSDTPPEDAVNIVPVQDITPVRETGIVYDTISIVTSKATVKRNIETTRTITVKPTVKISKGEIVGNVFRSQIGVRELTGHNDGVKVETYLRSTGLGKGNPWCAAFVHWCFERGGVKNGITAWSPTSVNKNNIVWFNKKFTRGPPEQADVFSLYFPHLGRIGHTGFVEKDLGNNMYQTVEGNTNDALSRDGDGVYRKKRSYNATYTISRWIPE